MYGLVNKAIKDLIVTNFGIEKWNQISQMSNFQDTDFISMKPYPDTLTYEIIKNASRVLEKDSEFLLEAFGEFWILYTAEEGYGNLLDLSGSTIKEFLENLDLLHTRIANIMPHLEPPTFTTQNATENSIELIYGSKREGLAPMCLGLIRGLGKRFHLDLTIVHSTKRTKESPFDIFSISWL